MDTHEIIQRERERLARIGSRKDPALFQAMRSHMEGQRRVMNRSVIVNFADDEHRFGCRFDCAFCSWKKRAGEIGDIAPTLAGLRRFLDGYVGIKVTVSGGGDPLFRLERNWPRLLQLINWIHSLGFLVEVVTKETALAADLVARPSEVVHKHPGMVQAIQEIDMFSLSYEGSNRQTSEEVADIAAHRSVRVSKVCSPGFFGTARGHLGRRPDALEKYCLHMRMAGAYQIILREDSDRVGQLREDGMRPIRKAIARGNGSVRWLTSAACSNNFFLIGDTVYHGDDVVAPAAKWNAATVTSHSSRSSE
jgi:hypothetical protein